MFIPLFKKANSLSLCDKISKSYSVSSNISWSGFQTYPSLVTITSHNSERALTTDAPTPCNPPDTLYPPPPNLPPACRTVIITSTVGFPIFGWIPTGIPLPSSTTVTELSLCMYTFIFLQYPANASSILLSTIS